MWMSSRTDRNETRHSNDRQKRRRSEHSEIGNIGGQFQSCDKPSPAKKTRLPHSSFEDEVTDDEFVIIELFSSDDQEKHSQSTFKSRKKVSASQENKVTCDSQVSPIYNNTSIFKKFQNQNEKESKEKTGSEAMFTQSDNIVIPLLPRPKRRVKALSQAAHGSRANTVPAGHGINLQNDSSSDSDEPFSSILRKKIRKATSSVSSNHKTSLSQLTSRNTVSSEHCEPMDFPTKVSPVFKQSVRTNRQPLKKKNPCYPSSDSFSDFVVVESPEESGKDQKKEEAETSDEFVTIGRRKKLKIPASFDGATSKQGAMSVPGNYQEKKETCNSLSERNNRVSVGRKENMKNKTRKSFQLSSESDDSGSLQQSQDCERENKSVVCVSDDDISCHSTASSNELLCESPQQNKTNKSRISNPVDSKAEGTKKACGNVDNTEEYEYCGEVGNKQPIAPSALFVSQKVREKLKQAISGKISLGNTQDDATEVHADSNVMTQATDMFVDSQDDSHIFIIGLEEEDMHKPLDATKPPDDDKIHSLDRESCSDDDLTQPLYGEYGLDEDELTQEPSQSLYGEPPKLSFYSRTESQVKGVQDSAFMPRDPPQLSLQTRTRSFLNTLSLSDIGGPPQLSQQTCKPAAILSVSPEPTVTFDSDSQYSNSTETFPEIDVNSNNRTITTVKGITCRSEGSTDSNASQSCLMFKPVVNFNDDIIEPDAACECGFIANQKQPNHSSMMMLQTRGKDKTTSRDLLQIDKSENQTGEIQSNLTFAKSVAFDLDMPLEVNDIKKEVLASEDLLATNPRKALPSKPPCYTQEEDVIFVYASSDDEALLDLSQSNIRSDHLSDTNSLYDIFDHSDTELFDDDNFDAGLTTVLHGNQDSCLEDLAQEKNNPFDHLGESDSDDALSATENGIIPGAKSGKHFNLDKSKLKDSVFSSKLNKEEKVPSPVPGENGEHDSCEMDLNEDLYFATTDIDELQDCTEDRGKVADIFAAETQPMSVIICDSDSSIFNASTEITVSESDMDAIEIYPRAQDIGLKGNKVLVEQKSGKRVSVEAKQSRMKLSESEETPSDEDLYMAATQMDPSVVGYAREGKTELNIDHAEGKFQQKTRIGLTLEESEETPSDEDLYMAATQMDSSVANMFRGKIVKDLKDGKPSELSMDSTRNTPFSSQERSCGTSGGCQGKPKRKTASVKKLDSTVQSTFKSSKCKSVSFNKSVPSENIYDADTQLDISGNAFQENFKTSTPKSLSGKPKTSSLLHINKLNLKDLYAAQTQAMSHPGCKSALDSAEVVAEYVGDGMDQDADDDALYCALDALEETSLSCLDTTKQEKTQGIMEADPYIAPTQAMFSSVKSFKQSFRCTGNQQERTGLYEAATQMDPSLNCTGGLVDPDYDVIVVNDDIVEAEIDPFDVLTQVDEQASVQTSCSSKKADKIVSSTCVPDTLLKKIKSNHLQKKSVMVAAGNLKTKADILKERKRKKDNKSASLQTDKTRLDGKSENKVSWLSKKTPAATSKSVTATVRRRKKKLKHGDSFSLTQKIKAAKIRQKERIHKSVVDPFIPTAKMRAEALHTSNSDVVLPDEDEIMAKGLPLLTYTKLVPKRRRESHQVNRSTVVDMKMGEIITIVTDSKFKDSGESTTIEKTSDADSKGKICNNLISSKSKSSSSSSKTSSKSIFGSSCSNSHLKKGSSHSSSHRSSHSSSHRSSSHRSSSSSSKHHSSKSSFSRKSSSSKSHQHSSVFSCSKKDENQKKEHKSKHSLNPSQPSASSRTTTSLMMSTSMDSTSVSSNSLTNPPGKDSVKGKSLRLGQDCVFGVLLKEVSASDHANTTDAREAALSSHDKSIDLSLYPLPSKPSTKPCPQLELKTNVIQDKGRQKVVSEPPVAARSDRLPPGQTGRNIRKDGTTGALVDRYPRKTIPVISVCGSKPVNNDRPVSANLVKLVDRKSAMSLNANRDPRAGTRSPVILERKRPNLLLKPSTAFRPVVAEGQMQKQTLANRGNDVILPFSQVLRGSSSEGNNCPSIEGHKMIQNPSKLLDSTYYLSRVLQWNPVWLHEQSKPEFAGHPPPILQSNEPVYPLLESYTSLDDYQDIMTRLLLLETWDMIFKEWKQKKVHTSTKVMFVSFDIYNKQDKGGLGKFVWKGLLTQDEYRRNLYPVEGDLVIMNIWAVLLPNQKEVKVQQVPPSWKATFGYVERMTLRPADSIHNLLRTYPILKSSVDNQKGEFFLITVTVLARYRRYKPVCDRMMSMESLCHMVTSRRQFQALTYLPRSPLLRDILHPSSPCVFQHNTLIQDKSLLRTYNQSQAEAISAVCSAVQEPIHMPRICLLQGPPGTGKTHTITGIITKIIQDSRGRCCVCLCTPSNGAADELMRRLIALRNGGGRNANMRLVRFGKTKSMHDDVLECAYDELLELARSKLENKKRSDLSSLPKSVKLEQQQLRQKIERLQKELKGLSISTHKIQIDRRQADLRKFERELQYLDKQQSTPYKHVQLTHEEESKLRRQILEEAHVICGTLNSIGSARIMNILRSDRNRNPFQCTIIDEATQATELDCLIPLQYGSSKLVLVGDPEQLPPTIISQRAKEMKFGLSLFERLYTYFKSKDDSPVLMLKTQYRMDAAILTFPNMYVYDGKLTTDRSVADRTRNFPLHPYLVFNIESGQECITSEGSINNQTEASCVGDLCHLIVSRTKILPARIGVICPYQSQKALVINYLNQKGLRDVETGTVDGFQGREKHVIIMSCVRARSIDGGIGFLSDRRRLNVALTRAKYSLFVIGHLDTLKRGADWRALIEDAQRRNVIISVPSASHFNSMAAYCFKANQASILVK